MILVDTSVWIDHLRESDPILVELLESVAVATHPLVIGELAVGSLRKRAEFLALLNELPRSPVVGEGEVLALINAHQLHGRGLGIVDVHLLASTLLAPGTSLWTRDARLRAAASSLGVLWRE